MQTLRLKSLPSVFGNCPDEKKKKKQNFRKKISTFLDRESRKRRRRRRAEVEIKKSQRRNREMQMPKLPPKGSSEMPRGGSKEIQMDTCYYRKRKDSKQESRKESSCRYLQSVGFGFG